MVGRDGAARFLHGVLPSALLEQHLWWMDDHDNIRGYPLVKDDKTKTYDHVILVEVDRQASQVWKRPRLWMSPACHLGPPHAWEVNTCDAVSSLGQSVHRCLA